MSNIEQGSGISPAPLSQAPPWYASGEGQYPLYPGYPRPEERLESHVRPLQIDVRTRTGLPWWQHVLFAFWAVFTCGYGAKHWIKATMRAQRVSRSRSR